VKIAALSPQFVFEAPVSAEQAEADRVAAEARRLRLVQTEASSDSEKLDQETREGLKRLSEIVRKHSKKEKTKPTGFLHVVKNDQYRERAISTYSQVDSEETPELARGKTLNKFL
jgi:hypothetical protein